MPPKSTRRACLTLRSDQLAALKGLSEATGAPMAELARRALDSFIAARLASPDHETGQTGRGTLGFRSDWAAKPKEGRDVSKSE
jgi:hypothetical protein